MGGWIYRQKYGNCSDLPGCSGSVQVRDRPAIDGPHGNLFQELSLTCREGPEGGVLQKEADRIRCREHLSPRSPCCFYPEEVIWISKAVIRFFWHCTLITFQGCKRANLTGFHFLKKKGTHTEWDFWFSIMVFNTCETKCNNVSSKLTLLLIFCFLYGFALWHVEWWIFYESVVTGTRCKVHLCHLSTSVL